MPALRDRRLWHEDRLHLSPAGHARVATALLEVLGVADPQLLAGARGWWREALPPPPRLGRVRDLLADVRWLRRHLLPWALRRLRGVSSGDLVAAKHDAMVEVVRADPAAGPSR